MVRHELDINRKRILKQMYMSQKRKIQMMVNKNKSEHEKTITQNIMKDKNRSKKLFKYIDKLRGIEPVSKKAHLIYDDDNNQMNPEEVKIRISGFWNAIYNKNVNNLNRIWNNEIRQDYENTLIPNNNNVRYDTNIGTIVSTTQISEHLDLIGKKQNQISPMNWHDISENEIKNQVTKMKNGAPGPDNIKPKIYKTLVENDNILTFLTKCFNKIMVENYIPKQWKEYKTILIPKKAKPKIQDFRPIALTNCSYKIFMGIIKNRSKEHLKMNNLENELQAGATEKRNTSDNNLILNYCINKSEKQRKPLYVMSIDFTKAFDSINREQMITTLMKYKFNSNIINRKLFDPNLEKNFDDVHSV